MKEATLSIPYRMYYFMLTVKCKLCKTRKLCYRKNDRAVRPIYGCPDNFQDSLTTPTATFPKILWVSVPMVPPERALVSFYRPSIVTFPLSLRISEILPLLFSRTPLFPYITSSLAKISPCSPGTRWIAFWLQRAKVPS